MPASSPWLDTWAPPQFGFVPHAQPPADPVTAGQDSGFLQSQGAGLDVGAQANSNAVDTTLHWKVSGTIIVALVVVFGLHAMGFRFVTSANVNLGR